MAMGDNLVVKDTKNFVPIQAKSTQTYTRDNLIKDFFLNFLENEKSKETSIIELLENLHNIDDFKIDIKT